MGSQKISSDGEDVSSDFFDDFTNDDFMEGLSVIDSWDEGEKKSRNVKLDNVRDLRELIERDGNEKLTQGKKSVIKNSRFRWFKESQNSSTGQGKSSKDLDEYIKPGSCRDRNKTNEAIKKDKEQKVKEHLAKHLDSTDDLRPPGTELDDFFDSHKSAEKEIIKYVQSEIEKAPSISKSAESPGKLHELSKRRKSISRHRELLRPRGSSVRRRESPMRRPRRESPRRIDFPPRRSIHWSPRHAHYSPRRSQHSPHRYRHSPRRSPRRSPHRSPRRSPRRSQRRSPRHSPHRYSPHKNTYHPRNPDTRRGKISRSHYRPHSRSHSPNNIPQTDQFLYPKECSVPPVYVQNDAGQVPYPIEGPPGYSYPQTPVFPTYSAPVAYNYMEQPISPGIMPAPLPVAAPTIPQHGLMPVVNDVSPVSVIVPQPQQVSDAGVNNPPVSHYKMTSPLPTDPLAQLVADGKLSHEDYLKLAPNKGAVIPKMDTKDRVAVINRCNNTIAKLSSLLLPNRLLINKDNNSVMCTDVPSLEPKYCSPLKRRAAVEFNFTQSNNLPAKLQNKRVVDSLVDLLSLEPNVNRSVNVQKNMKDAAVQTSKPFCDMCEVRESTSWKEKGTSTDPEYFSASVHTQVVEKDLYSSKSVFNPTGSIADGAPLSIAHMTPAQLVSQLAARAKTFKQSEPSPPYNSRGSYDYDDNRDPGYRNNYRYNRY